MNTLFYTILGYVWQYVTNPKVMMALSFFVVIISMKNTVSDRVFWVLVAVYSLILVVWGIYTLIALSAWQKRRGTFRGYCQYNRN